MSMEIILGPPGTGKTTSLLNIVDEELERGVAPDRIAYVTFTRRAAEEAITRATEKFKLSASQLPHFRTLHSLCYRALNLSPTDVMTAKRMKDFAEWIGVKITGRYAEDGSFNGYEVGDRIMHIEHLARVRQVPLRVQYDIEDDGLPWGLVDRVARGYKEYKAANALLDYTDMLFKFLESNVKLRLDVVLDDEAQDQSALQWAVVRKIAANSRRQVAAGDDDQALYKWAGADVDNFIDLDGDSRVLDRSYRTPRNVQTVASSIINRVRHRRAKVWASREEAGQVDYAQHFEEADCANGQVLVLARNIYILKEHVEPALRRSGIIYEHNGHSSVSKDVLEAIVGWEKLRAGEKITIAEAKTVYEYISSGTGIRRGFKTLSTFKDDEQVSLHDLQSRGGLLVQGVIWHEALDRIPKDEASYILAARKRGEKLLSAPRVRISTIHGAKGGEAEHVVLLKEMARRTYREMELDEDSERRVWYVGATRAKQKLTVVESTTQQACPWL
jgi:DNA helicase-2/ATP-dependent DNA helicase PcrA